MTAGLEELVIPGLTSKGSHYHKAFYTYPRTVDTSQTGFIKAGQIQVEINSFANPYPFGPNPHLITEYEMQPFIVNVLDKKRTLTEKLVSLVRCSLADAYMPQLIAKIRHFYDLHHLLQDNECREYLYGRAFTEDFQSLLDHDREVFDKPEGWRDRSLKESPLMTDLPKIWRTLQEKYLQELPDLAYRQIPLPETIEIRFRYLKL